MEITEAVKGRRSVNFFDADRVVSGAQIRELLELANLAPSSLNLQPWKVVAVSDKEKRKILRKCAMGQPKVEEAPVTLIVVADPSALEENIDKVLASSVALGYMDAKTAAGYKGFAGKHYGDKESLTRKIFAVKNASFFAMSVMIAARGLGLETHPMDGFDEACVKREFAIADDKIIPLLIAVGYLKPGTKLLPRAYRRAVEDFARFV